MLEPTQLPGCFLSNRSTGEVIPQEWEASDRLRRVVRLARYQAPSSIVSS